MLGVLRCPNEGFITLQSDTEESLTDTEESDSEQLKAPLPSLTGSLVVNKSFLEPLNIVWAKIPGYQWRPGVIFNPKTIKNDLQLLKMKDVKLPTKEFLSKTRDITSNDHLVCLFRHKKPW